MKVRLARNEPNRISHAKSSFGHELRSKSAPMKKPLEDREVPSQCLKVRARLPESVEIARSSETETTGASADDEMKMPVNVPVDIASSASSEPSR
jgi:hypothetical protein